MNEPYTVTYKEKQYDVTKSIVHYVMVTHSFNTYAQVMMHLATYGMDVNDETIYLVEYTIESNRQTAAIWKGRTCLYEDKD